MLLKIYEVVQKLRPKVNNLIDLIKFGIFYLSHQENECLTANTHNSEEFNIGLSAISLLLQGLANLTKFNAVITRQVFEVINSNYPPSNI